MWATPGLSSLTSICETTKATLFPSGAHCGSRTSFSFPRSSSESGRFPLCAAATPTEATKNVSANSTCFIAISLGQSDGGNLPIGVLQKLGYVRLQSAGRVALLRLAQHDGRLDVRESGDIGPDVAHGWIV